MNKVSYKHPVVKPCGALILLCNLVIQQAAQSRMHCYWRIIFGCMQSGSYHEGSLRHPFVLHCYAELLRSLDKTLHVSLPTQLLLRGFCRISLRRWHDPRRYFWASPQIKKLNLLLLWEEEIFTWAWSPRITAWRFLMMISELSMLLLLRLCSGGHMCIYAAQGRKTTYGCVNGTPKFPRRRQRRIVSCVAIKGVPLNTQPLETTALNVYKSTINRKAGYTNLFFLPSMLLLHQYFSSMTLLQIRWIAKKMLAAQRIEDFAAMPRGQYLTITPQDVCQPFQVCSASPGAWTRGVPYILSFEGKEPFNCQLWPQ